MPTPLQQDKQTIKEFGITPEVDLPTDQKLAFIQSQITELRSMAYRERVNILHALRLQEDKNEVMSAKGLNNIVEHRNGLRQFCGAIKTLTKLQEELEAEQ